ncbi:unnamed protein product [Cladocopium goreaui]|uniref:C3H1-type domain-containing protein n=1 Tax=Cladocopium goreaui TaxID=2562237 RepID=A0A9P1GH77_9DINO|nr:unnamed protein product [Cladocopium goreaui]
MSAEWRQKEFQKPWNPKMSAEWRQKELWKPNIPKRCSKESLAAQCSPLPPVAGTIRLALSQAGEIDADFANFVEEKPEDTHTGLLWCPKCPWNESFHASDRWEWKQGHGKPYQVWIQKMVSKDKCIKGAMGMFDHKKVVCSHHLEGKCVKAAADKCKFEHPSKQKVVKALAELIRRGRQGEDLPSSAASEMGYGGYEDLTELDCVKFQVAGIPTHWKAFYIFFVLLPKFALWLAVAKSGVHYLMETAGIVDLIVNSMALTFVLEVDEMVFHRFTTALTKHIMNNIEDLPNFDTTREETETDQQALERFKAEELGNARWAKLRLCLPWRFLIVLLLEALFVFHYYHVNCVKLEDGSWVSKELRLPKDLAYRPVELMFGLLSTDGDPVWSMPPSE